MKSEASIIACSSSRRRGSPAAYRAFWEALGRGEYQAAEYKRVGKGGRTIWIQASYNPIHDADGKIMKVVKFATDIDGPGRGPHPPLGFAENHR